MRALPEAVDCLVQVTTGKAHAAAIAGVLASLAKHGGPLVARLDHAAAAGATGLALSPTDLLIFGSAAVGTPLTCAADSIAIDLPLKLLVQRVSGSGTRLSYNDPAWIAKRHHLSPVSDHIIAAMRVLLAAVVHDATERGRS